MGRIEEVRTLHKKGGRKTVILICTVIFSVFTFISGFANGPDSFGIQRFIAGIGLGGVMPNLIALVTEDKQGTVLAFPNARTFPLSLSVCFRFS